MAEFVANTEAMRRREFRRLIGISLIFHLLVVLFLIWNPIPAPSRSLPGVLTVQLLAAPAAETPPAPTPVARPKPPPPAAEKVVLPEKPKPLEAPKPKPEPKPMVQEKPKPEPRPEVEKKPEPQQFAYEDVLAQLRAETGETAPRPTPAPAEAVPALPGGGRGVPISPEQAAWIRSVKIHLRQSWVLAPGFRLQQLSTLVRVDLDAQGNLNRSPKVVRSSGNPWYDDSTVRAVEKAAPLPAPPRPGQHEILFVPQDYFR